MYEDAVAVGGVYEAITLFVEPVSDRAYLFLIRIALVLCHVEW